MRGFVAAALALGLMGCALGASVPVAKEQVPRFRAMLDAGKCPDIYANATDEFTGAISAEGWTKLCEAIRTKLGKFVSAGDPGWTDNYRTGGHFIALTYASKYEKGEATEEFVYRVIDGKAVLSGYHINSNAMMVN